MIYDPLVEQKGSYLVEVTANDLGTYPYQFNLEAHSAISEPTVKLQTFLGNSVMQRVFINNHTSNKVDFISKVRFL